MAAQATSVALTALLNSLHTHLQHQTQLLPTLHAQLGLPPSALEDDLKDLEKQLMQSVESQIERRRKEVDYWSEKCETIEAECLRYSKAVGGNVKATGGSVGELRKVLVLPKRFEMVSEHQETLRQASGNFVFMNVVSVLRQVYHTKFEQLSVLTNRLKALSRTLGSVFFTEDVLEPVAAAGDNSNDPNTYMNVTPERFLRLEKELVRGKAEVSKRLQHLSATFFQIDWLYTELGISPCPLDDFSSLPSNLLGTSLCTSQQFSALASKSISSDPFSLSTTPTPSSCTRSVTPLLFQENLPAPETEYQRIFANFVTKVEEADDESLFENSSIPTGLQNVEPTQGLLAWAENLQSSLEETKRRREAHIQAMYDQLEGLWRRLGVDEADMDAFVEAHRGSTEDTIREYEEELERMLELKRERMGAFIASARGEIMKLWDDLMIGDDERADFAPFADDEHTEELLTIHEDEIRRLKEERRQKAPLLTSIKKYFDICEEEKELDAAASDQTRLLGRGRGGDPGRLLREEKMRRRVIKEKPRLEQDLLTSIPAWEEEAQRPFLVHGESILQLLMETVSAADQENKRKPTRADSVPARATTPVNSYAPDPKARSRSASQSIPNKRQKLDSVPIGHTRQGNDKKGQGQVKVSRSNRPPLGSHRGGNTATSARAASPSKIPGRTPSGGSSLPRPAPIVMPIPKPGTQHHALGHGRTPTSATYMVPRAASSARMTSGVYGARYPSTGSRYGVQTVVKKATRARRESFKPRPSVDGDMCVSVALGSYAGRWSGLAGSVREEDEG